MSPLARWQEARDVRRRMDSDRMSRRASKYLRAAGNRHAILAVFFIGFPHFFVADVYRHIEKLLPFAHLWLWGVACAAVAFTNWWATYTKTEYWAWRGLIGSYVLGCIMAAAYLTTWILNGTPTPVVLTALIYLARKDFIQLGDPMRSPFDPVVEVYADDVEAHDAEVHANSEVHTDRE